MRKLIFVFAVVMLAGCASGPKTDYVAPVHGEVVKSYGPAKNGFRHGVYVEAPGGSLVYATMDGKVTYRGKTKNSGRMIVIDHGAGVKTYYGSLSAFKARRGQLVKKGDKIGRIGRKKDIKPSHLHFQLRLQKQSIDPESVVPFATAKASTAVTRAKKPVEKAVRADKYGPLPPSRQ